MIEKFSESGSTQAVLSPDASTAVLWDFKGTQPTLPAIDLATKAHVNFGALGDNNGFFGQIHNTVTWVGQWVVVPTQEGIALWKPGMDQPTVVTIDQGPMLVEYVGRRALVTAVTSPRLARDPPVGRISVMNIVVCVKQIPDPASPGALDPSTNTLQAGRETDPGRVGQLRRRDGAAVGRQGREAAKCRSSRWRRTVRCPACARHSPWAPPRVCWSATPPFGLRCADDSQGARRCGQAARQR